MDERTLVTQIGDLSRQLADAGDLDAVLEMACRAAVEPTGATGVGIFLREGKKVRIGAVAGPGMVAAELIQLRLDEGPCLSAITEREPVIAVDLRSDERWPHWAQEMTRRGWRSALAVRLTGGKAGSLGSLNLFSTRTDAFDADDADVAEIFGGVISAALLGARTQDQLQQAIGARHTIGVAQGILMQHYDLPSVDAAFEVLRRYSQDHNVKLSRVAAHVIEHRALPDLAS